MACCKNWKEAITNVHPECLRKFLKKRKPVSALVFAIRSGKFDCLHVFMEFNYTWPRDTGYIFAKLGRIDLLDYAYNHGLQMHWRDFSGACEYDSIECMKYLHARNCPIIDSVLVIALRHKKLEHVEYLCEIGIPINNETIMCHAVLGKPEYLEYIMQHGGKWFPGMYRYVSKNLQKIKLLHKMGCPWDIESCRGIASGGKLKNLIFAHDNGCPWNENVFMAAAQNGRLDCLKYMYENKCPIGTKEDYNCLDMYKYVPKVNECITYINSLFDKN